MKAKKVLAMLMASAMIMGASVTTFAAESTNVVVTVDNAEKADVYYLQIVEADPTSTSGWKYVDDYKTAFADVSIETLINIAKQEKDTVGENYYATNDKINDGSQYISSNLAETLESFRATVVGSENNKVTGTSFTAQAGGLYVLVPEKAGYTYSPTLVYVPVNGNKPVTVDVKGSNDQIEKELVYVDEGIIEGADGDASVTANDEVEYKVTIKYPYIADNFSNPSFKITDAVENGVFVKDTLKVKLSDGTSTTDYDDYTVKKSTGEDLPEDTNIGGLNGIVIEFTNYDSSKAGQDIILTYTVKVSENVSAANPLTNKAKSELKLEPDGTPKRTESKVISDPVSVEFSKVDATTTSVTLDGAVFALYEGLTTDENAKLVSIMADAETTEGIELPSAYQSFGSLLKADGEANGEIKFDGLDGDREYYIVEIIAPDGYSVDATKH